MAEKLLGSIVHDKQDLEAAQRSTLIEQGVLIVNKSCNETNSTCKECMARTHGCASGTIAKHGRKTTPIV